MNVFFRRKRLSLPVRENCSRLEMRGVRLLLALLLASLLPASCQVGPSWQSSPSWSYVDLRVILSAPGDNPSHEIAAVYARSTGDDLQIRLDLLDSPEEVDYDLYLALDSSPGGGGAFPLVVEPGMDWNVLVVIPANGPITAVRPDGGAIPGLRLRVQRDPYLDTVVISLDRRSLGKPKGNLPFQVFLASAGSLTPQSYSGILSSDGWKGSSPPPRVEIMLVFWDTFPAASPAQALRRWDGAHTGPNSERHGLRNLLRAFSETKTPAALLDLKNPASLSALDYVGGLEQVLNMEDSGLLVLPDTSPIASAWSESIEHPSDTALLKSIRESRMVGSYFGFKPSQFLYYPSSEAPPQGSLAEGNYRFIFHQEIPLESALQLDSEGPSLEMRRTLLQYALEPGERKNSPVIMGGSLADSSWGNYPAALNTIRYLKSRPWISFRSPADLAANSQPTIQANRLGSTQAASPGPVSDLAWQFYRDLLSPPSPIADRLNELRAGYLGQAGFFHAAADWAEDPLGAFGMNGCQVDLDGDGMPECVLSSNDVFLILKPEGGFAPLGFARTETGVHQILGPSSQFVVGMSDPSAWKPELGQTGEPRQLRGAFSDVLAGFGTPSWETYSTETNETRMTFTSSDGSLVKTYQLAPGGFTVDYRTEKMIEVQVPLVLDPEHRFSPGWRESYQVEIGENKMVWYLQGGPRLELYSEKALVVRSFIDSRDSILAPENPNFEFPPGHFLPFPMVLAELTAQGEFTLKLSISD
jgi:hypothetical protein